MEVIHIKQPRRKTYSLQINESGSLVVKTNASFSNRDIQSIIAKHNNWIEKQLIRFKHQLLLQEHKQKILLGGYISILNEKYAIELVPSMRKRPLAEIQGNKILVKASQCPSEEELKRVIIKLLKESAKETIAFRAIHYAKAYGLEFKNIAVKNQKTKWGSCSTYKNLNFNWQLILCPRDILDYVVIHEICHLKEMNHSKKFWNLVSLECPDHRLKRKWLRENGNLVRI